jgi:iron complex transport system substrate-binding protein
LYDIALLHSSYLSFFKLLNVTDHLSAISEGKYVYDHELYSSVISGALPEVGHGESLDKEKLLALGVSSVFTVGWPNVPNKSQQILGELGIPVLIFSDWQETTLLGRLEWIKVIAAFTGKGEVADSIFSEIESRYEYLRSQAISVDEKPEVVCNLPYKGSWYLPGGNSYVSNVLQDAGASYLWSGHPETGGVQIDFEAVYAKGIMADYWINTGFARGIDEIVSSDERLKDFKAVATGKVFNNNRRLARDAANDYWESGIVRPDIILADLIRIFHPDLLPDHELYYYQNLN